MHLPCCLKEIKGNRTSDILCEPIFLEAVINWPATDKIFVRLTRLKVRSEKGKNAQYNAYVIWIEET
jgi:hypothetical protein